MKKYTALILLALCLVFICSCNNTAPDNITTQKDTAPDVTVEGAGDPFEEYRKHLYGNWINTDGDSEPIDEETVNGTPYTIKDITRDAKGNLIYTLTVGESDVIYTVYRYKTGYAEYSYMEANFGAKDVVFKFHK